uniref:Proteasome inhibitor PI31 subunit n=1 Tax=Arion vulgaris TaxID=1028688 RepID=A0A0B6Z812_9EUPU
MTLPGFELLYTSVAPQIRTSDDALISAVHWNLISSGLKCCGRGETWPTVQNESHVGSEALPTDWNSDSSIYALRYVDPTSNRTYLMKALAMDGMLMLHLVRCFDEKSVSTTLRSRDYVNDDLSTLASAFNSLDELNDNISRELITRIVTGSKGQSSAKSSTSATSNQRVEQPGRSPLMEDPRRPYQGGVGFNPPHQPLRPDVNPFSVGRADLDPLGGGMGGGMFMDPRGFPGFRPGGSFGQTPPGFPPGSVPPGARFDPVGPPGVRPQPDPDHERPPNYDDMFM